MTTRSFRRNHIPKPCGRQARRPDAHMDKPSSTFDNLPGEKRQRVLDESLREFAEHGYHQASINRIVGRLGIAKGSVFQYFGSKDGLFRHLFASALDQLKAPLRAIRDEAGPEGFEQRLKRVFRTASRFAQAHPLIWRLYRRLIHHEDFPLRAALLGQVRGEALTYFRELIEAGQARGEVRADIDADAAAFALEAVLDRALTAQDLPVVDCGLGLSSPDESARLGRLDELALILSRGLSASTPQGAKE